MRTVKRVVQPMWAGLLGWMYSTQMREPGKVISQSKFTHLQICKSVECVAVILIIKFAKIHENGPA